MFNKSITVVIPVYNEEDCIQEVIENTFSALERNFNDFEILVINDGSTDKTREIAESVASRQKSIKIINLAKNGGFGNAVKHGFNLARKDLLIYVPSDNQFDVSEIASLVPAIDYSDIVLAYRDNRLQDTVYRRILSRGFKLLIHIIFDIEFCDVNWIHLYKREIFDKIKISSNGVFFCGEIVVKAKRAGYKFSEIKTSFYKRKAGATKNFKFKVVLQTFIDMLRVKFNLNKVN